MKHLKILSVLVFVAVTALVTSCKSKDPEVLESAVKIHLTKPGNAVINDLNTIKVEFVHQTTMFKTLGTVSSENLVTAKLEQGVYNVSVIAKAKVSVQDANGQFIEQDVTLRGVANALSISGTDFNHTIELFVNYESNAWVFKEIYFAGSSKPGGGSYFQDKYFEIYNNTNQTLYADGLCLSEADHTNALSPNPYQDIIDEYFLAYVVYQIPGDGTTYPVEPGKSIIIADVGKNHSLENPHAADMSIADFEWYDEHALDVDVPEVPNMYRAFCGSASIYTPHSRGYKAWAIFDPQKDIQEFLNENSVDVTTPSSIVVTRIKVPNANVVDAVEAGDGTKFAAKAISTKLDLSFADVGADTDALKNKVIRRKVKETDNGRVIYLDTNNSDNDFEINVERQPKQY